MLSLLLPVAMLYPSTAQARTPNTALPVSSDPASGGAVPEQPAPRPRRLQLKSRILPNGKATVPKDAPRKVQQAIQAANRIVGKPYVYGGGHGGFESGGYDCSGSVSYALHGAGLVSSPMPSGPLMSWGKSGRGKWITVYANGGHAFVHIANLRLDTSSEGDTGGGKGPRWRPLLRSTGAYTARHPSGL